MANGKKSASKGKLAPFLQQAQSGGKKKPVSTSSSKKSWGKGDKC